MSPNIQRIKKQPNKRKKINLQKIGLISLLSVQFIALIAIISFVIYRSNITKQYGDEISDANNFSVTKIQILDVANQDIGNFGSAIAEPKTFEEFSEAVIDAQISSEDGRFYIHNGFDPKRTFIDLVKALLPGRGGGASTITQQVARINFLRKDDGTYDQTISRKVKELALAQGIEQNFTKSKILEMYLNTIQLSTQTYGSEATMKKLFNKSAKNATLYESLVISGMASAPAMYDPSNDYYHNAEKSVTHRNIMADLFMRSKYINDFERKAITEFDFNSGFEFQSDIANTTVSKNAYVNGVLNELSSKYGISPGTNQKITIKTNYDEAIQSHIYESYQSTSYKPNSSFAMVESSSGKVKGIYAGDDFKQTTDLNFALDAYRSPGSAIKPVLPYATYINENKLGSNSLVDDVKTYYSGTDIEIRNYDNVTTNGRITIRQALETSRNTSAIYTYRENENNKNTNKMQEIIDTTGFKLDENQSLFEGNAIGSKISVTPLQLAATYAAFVNGGIYNEPQFISSVENSNGQNIERIKSPVSKRIFSEETAYILADIGRTTVTNGTAKSLSGLNYWNGGKTGTNGIDEENVDKNAARDIWYAGYNADYAYAIWSGYNKTNVQTNEYVTDNDRAPQYKILNQILKKVTPTNAKPTRPANIVGVEGQSLYFANGQVVPDNNLKTEKPKEENESIQTPIQTPNKENENEPKPVKTPTPVKSPVLPIEPTPTP